MRIWIIVFLLLSFQGYAQVMPLPEQVKEVASHIWQKSSWYGMHEYSEFAGVNDDSIQYIKGNFTGEDIPQVLTVLPVRIKKDRFFGVYADSQMVVTLMEKRDGKWHEGFWMEMVTKIDIVDINDDGIMEVQTNRISKWVDEYADLYEILNLQGGKEDLVYYAFSYNLRETYPVVDSIVDTGTVTSSMYNFSFGDKDDDGFNELTETRVESRFAEMSDTFSRELILMNGKFVGDPAEYNRMMKIGRNVPEKDLLESLYKKWHMLYMTEVKEAVPPTVRYIDHDYSYEYKSLIIETAAKGSNFAGKYIFVEWECGAACQYSIVIDAESGAIYEGPIGATGFEYFANSEVLVVNGVMSKDYLPCHRCNTKVYRFSEGKFIELE